MLFLILTTAKLFGAQLQLIVTFKNHSREIMIWLSAILSISWDVILCSRVYIVAKLVSPPGWKKTLITEIISHPILMSYDLFFFSSVGPLEKRCVLINIRRKNTLVFRLLDILSKTRMWTLNWHHSLFELKTDFSWHLTAYGPLEGRLMRYFQQAFLPILLHAPVVKRSFLNSHFVVGTKKILKCLSNFRRGY